MASSVALLAAVLIAVALAAWIGLLAVVASGVWWLRRRVRRRLHLLGLTSANRPRRAAASAGAADSWWLWSLPMPDRRWWSGVRARRELWRAVSAAEHAVAAAHHGGAPIGDLDGLCRRLRRAAGSADRSLAVWPRSAVAGVGLENAAGEVRDVVSAAGQIQTVAAAALASVSRPAARELADDVRAEVVALTAGIASAAGGTGASPVPGTPA
jgi:hypothetical protein